MKVKANKKYFGTDGIRAPVGQPPMTPDLVLKLGWGIGKAFYSINKKVIVGKDTRLSGYLFEAALEAGIISAGMDYYLSGPLPTPALSYMTRTLNAACGIVISASHNPFYDNGIKLLAPDGSKLSEDKELEIEYWMDQTIAVAPSDQLGKGHRIRDCQGRYIEYCKSSTVRGFSLEGVSIVLDCANGATYNTAPNVFSELGADVHAINNAPDGLNINRDCGALHPEQLSQVTVERQADIGIGWDGDGDRLVIVDRKGNAYDGDDIIILLLNDRLRKGSFHGGVVGTPVSNLGLEQAIRKRGIEFLRVPVGDPHILRALKERNWVLGGETSGHIICTDKMITADAVIAALEVCEAMMPNDFDFSIVSRLMRKYPSKTVNVPCPHNRTQLLKKLEPSFTEAKKTLGNKGRIVVRASGTEPCMRVMVEADSHQLCNEWASNLTGIIREAAEHG